MGEISKRDDWQINKNVKIEFNKRWVDSNALQISSTGGRVFIKGTLCFTGRNKSLDRNSTLTLLKTLDTVIRGVRNVRDVRWSLAGYERVGTRWRYNPTTAKL